MLSNQYYTSMTTMQFPFQSVYEWYKVYWRHNFPWRNYVQNSTEILLYRVWLAEILLQQTQADRVIPFYEKIIRDFPTISSLASASYEEFFPYYKWLGYYSRARNILKTASIVSKEYASLFPRDIWLLRKLPGIGEYTANAILAFGYGESVLAWDTNLEKIFSRFLYGTSLQKVTVADRLAIIENFKEFVWGYSKDVQSEVVRTINNGLMDISRTLDLKNPENINWEQYPIQTWKFYETRWKEEVYIQKTKENFPTPDAKIVAIVHENHKVYFSATTDQYLPFILPSSESRNIREYVKKYFLQVYNLEVSVRPAHKKWLSEDWEPWVAVNVQIQTGNENFKRFTKNEIKDILNIYK